MALLAVLFVVPVSSCSNSPESTTLDDLKSPVLTWDRQRGLCGKGLAVDGDGELWIDEGGCEDGGSKLSSGGLSDPAKLATLRKAFDKLPKDSGPEGDDECSGNLDRFSERMGTASIESRTCASSGYDLKGLHEPYLSAAKAFLALP